MFKIINTVFVLESLFTVIGVVVASVIPFVVSLPVDVVAVDVDVVAMVVVVDSAVCGTHTEDTWQNIDH